MKEAESKSGNVMALRSRDVNYYGIIQKNYDL